MSLAQGNKQTLTFKQTTQLSTNRHSPSNKPLNCLPRPVYLFMAYHQHSYLAAIILPSDTHTCTSMGWQ